MVNILVRNVTDTTKAGLKKKAKAAGKSVNDLARQALDAAAKPGKEEIWAAADRISRKDSRQSGTRSSRLDCGHTRRSRPSLK